MDYWITVYLLKIGFKKKIKPEEFKELLKEAGSKRTTAIETVKRLFEGVKKPWT